MPRTSYLHCKNGRYYARIRTPKPLLPWLDQHEIRWSLQTGCLKTAYQHLLIANVLIHELFKQVHMEIATSPLTELEKIRLKNRIERIKQEKLQEFRDLISQGPTGIAQAQWQLDQEQLQTAAFQSALETGHFDSIAVKGPASDLIEVVPRLGQEFSALNPNYNHLAKEFSEGMVWQHGKKAELLSDALTRLKQRPGNPPPQIVVNHFHQTAASPQPQRPENTQTAPATSTNAKPAPRISEMVSAYLTEQKAQGTLLKTLQEYEGVLGRFVAFTKDAPVDQIKGSDIKAFREALKKYPTRLKPAQKNQSFEQIIASEATETLSTPSINKYLTRLGQLYHWAARNEYDVKADLAVGHTLKDRRRDRDQRDRYDQDDITKLFSTPDYQGTETFARTAFYWAPLIALHTGMRIEEICQLRVADVRLDKASKIPIIDINDEDDDRKLKPGQSTARVIPIHPKLIELGLMDYADMLRSKKHRMLFPTLTKHEKNGYSHAVTKWFSDHKKSLGFGKEHTFHSLRHTVADTLKQASVEEAQVNAIMGHTSESMSMKRYGKDYKPEVLLPVIQKIAFNLPVKKFSECSFSDPEKQALRSREFAEALKEKRIAARNKGEPNSHEENT